MTLLPARDGRPFWTDSEGKHWRTVSFIERTLTFDRTRDPVLARNVAAAFARFLRDLADFPPPRLHETIPRFHDTPFRFENLMRAVNADPLNRAAACRHEIRFFESCRPCMDTVVRAMAEGRVPERVTHNDTKLNNVLIDETSGEGICVVDLDTVMPGSALYDFGDMVRSAVNPADEDERETRRLEMRMPIFQAMAEGFLREAGGMLTGGEWDLLAGSSRLISLELAMRFLTDHLEGDRIFRVRHPGRNLDRCRIQMSLAQSIERNLPDMEAHIRGLR
jgi:aminoglycoside phosphotransferase (APT) family kinase protein